MYARIGGELWMERRGEHVALPHEYGAAFACRRIFDGRQHLNLAADLDNPGGTDEDRIEFSLLAGHRKAGLERIHLAAKSVALYDNVEHTELRLLGPGGGRRQEDHSGTCAENGHSLLDAFAQRLDQAVDPGKPADRRGLSPGDDEAVDSRQFLARANLGHGTSETFEHLTVLPKVSLKGQHADRAFTGHDLRGPGPACALREGSCRC